MTIAFDPISATGTRDLAINLTSRLESAETLSAATVTSANASVLAVSNTQINVSAFTIDGVTVAIGKGVTFTVTGLAAGTDLDQFPLTVAFTGTSGTGDTYEVILPIDDKLRE